MTSRIGLVLWFFWGIIVLPIWLLGMGFAGEFRLLPDNAFQTLEGFIFLLLMYAPPLVGTWMILRNNRNDSQNAKN